MVNYSQTYKIHSVKQKRIIQITIITLLAAICWFGRDAHLEEVAYTVVDKQVTGGRNGVEWHVIMRNKYDKYRDNVEYNTGGDILGNYYKYQIGQVYYFKEWSFSKKESSTYLHDQSGNNKPPLFVPNNSTVTIDSGHGNNINVHQSNNGHSLVIINGDTIQNK